MEAGNNQYHFMATQGVSTILMGDAPKQYNPANLSITGDINAPLSYAEVRKGIDINDSFVTFDYKNLNITLIVGEHLEVGQKKIKGQLRNYSLWNVLKLNNEKVYTKEDLLKIFKFLPHIFVNPEHYRQLMFALENFNAEVVYNNSESKTSGSGSKNKAFKIDHPLLGFEFQIKVPLFEGCDPQIINLSLYLEPQSGSVVFYVICEPFEQMKVDFLEKIYSDILDRFAVLGYVTIKQY